MPKIKKLQCLLVNLYKNFLQDYLKFLRTSSGKRRSECVKNIHHRVQTNRKNESCKDLKTSYCKKLSPLNTQNMETYLVDFVDIDIIYVVIRSSKKFDM